MNAMIVKLAAAKFISNSLVTSLLLAAFPAVATTITDANGKPYQPGTKEPSLGIEITDGTVVGENLLFSFEQFDLNEGDTALYLNEYGTPIRSIINRVTGDASSSISGTIDTLAFDNANYFFVNPNGITFSAKATVDVNGSFYVSTASTVRQGDSFLTIGDRDDSASAAAPTAFVFESKDSKAIKFIASPERPSSRQSIVKNGDFVATSNDIVIDRGRLKVVGGNIYLSTMTDGSNEFSISDKRSSIKSNRTPNGNLEILNGASIIAVNSTIDSKETGGGVYLSTNDLTIKNLDDSVTTPNKITSNVKTNAKEQLYINALGGIELNGDSHITSLSQSTDKVPAPLIEVTGFKSLKLSNGATIDSSVSTSSEPIFSGDISIDSRNGRLELSGLETAIKANASGGENVGGTLSIRVLSLLLEDTATIQASSSGSSANATNKSGDVVIDSERITINNAIITNENSGSGQGGSIIINGFTSMEMKESAAITSTTTGSGNGGRIELTGKSINIVKGSQIRSESSNLNGNDVTGESGDITLNAKKVFLSGKGSSLSVKADQSDAGDIFIESSGAVIIKDGAVVSTSVSDADGSGGNITFEGTTETSTVYLGNDASVTANTEQGKGGVILFRRESIIGYNNPSVRVEAKAGDPEGTDGEIRFINSTLDELSGTEELPDNILDSSALTSKRCYDNPSGRSNFYINDQQGIKSSPKELVSTRSGYIAPQLALGPKDSNLALERKKSMSEPVFFTCARQLN